MNQVNVLFVCLGNICRSPAAEGIFRTKVEDAGLKEIIIIESAGTHAYHSGEKADKRMIGHALKRGYNLQGTARRFDPHSDFEKHHFIIAMDGENYNDLKAMDVKRKFSNKIFLMTDFCRNVRASEVPDPYYGGEQGFELVLNILEDACTGLLEKIKNDFRIST